MKYLKIDVDTFIEYDPDTKRARVVSRAELQQELDFAKAQLLTLPQPKTNAELLAWAKANYPETNYEASRLELKRQIAKLELRLADIDIVRVG